MVAARHRAASQPRAAPPPRDWSTANRGRRADLFERLLERRRNWHDTQRQVRLAAGVLDKRALLQFPMYAAGQRRCAADQYDHLQDAAILSCVAGKNQPAARRTEFWRKTGHTGI